MFHTYIQGNNQFLRKKAFTLVEMLIVVVIIGILAAALIPRLVGAQSQARDVARKKHLSDIFQGTMLYYNDNGNFPDGDCTYHLSDAYKSVPGAYGNTPSTNSNIVQTNISKWSLTGYLSDIPKDPQSNKTHPMNRVQRIESNTDNICKNGYYAYRGFWSNGGGIMLWANMENYKNLNFVLPNPKDYSLGGKLYFDPQNTSGEFEYVKSNFCNDGLKKGNGACQTNNINSGVYLYLGYPSAQ